MRFDDGINFTFPDLTFLAPGERLLIVRHLAAFTERYGSSFGSTPVVGTYTGRLSNDGEHVLVASPQGTLIEFTYNDQPDWPTIADGDGPSLVLIAPFSAPSHNDPFNWRPSTSVGGAPGRSDSLSLAGWMSLLFLVGAALGELYGGLGTPQDP